MTDLVIIETGNGGDLMLRGKDIAWTEGVEGMAYMAMFGTDGEQEWWANAFMEDSQRFTGATAKALKTTALNSAGRLKIEEAIKSDLAFFQQLDPANKTTIQTQIAGDNRLDIYINLNGKTIYLQWLPANDVLNAKPV